LRRVATLVARDAPPGEVFAAVTEEVGRLLGVHFSGMGRFDSGDTVTVLVPGPPKGRSTPWFRVRGRLKVAILSRSKIRFGR